MNFPLSLCIYLCVCLKRETYKRKCLPKTLITEPTLRSHYTLIVHIR